MSGTSHSTNGRAGSGLGAPGRPSVPTLIVGVVALIAMLVACASRTEAGKASAQPAATLNADTLIVSLEDVQRITNFDDLSSDSRFDVHQPGQLDAGAPEPCRVIYDQQATFAAGWTQFRSVQYSGAANKSVGQAIGIYPSAVDARAAFDRLSGAVAQCAALHADGYEFTVDNIDPSTLTTCFADDCRVIFAVRSSVLIGVSVQHFARTSDQISTAIVQAITNRITGT